MVICSTLTWGRELCPGMLRAVSMRRFVAVSSTRYALSCLIAGADVSTCIWRMASSLSLCRRSGWSSP